MYSSHSKDINRNKSFHPLTFSNLRRVERLKETAEEKIKSKNAREEELRRDQELRRYDDLLLNATSMTTSTAQLNSDRQTGTALYNQVQTIFAAEYNKRDIFSNETEKREKEELVADGKSEREYKRPNNFVEIKVKTESSSNGESSLNNELGKNIVQNKFLSKFHKFDSDEEFDNESDNLLECDKIEELKSKKRRREERKEENVTEKLNTDNEPSHSAQALNKDRTETMTGLISTAETVKLKKELDLIKKERLDPLRKVHQFNNKTIATEARAHGWKKILEEEKQRIYENNSTVGESELTSQHLQVNEEENDMNIHAYVTQLLAIKRRRM